MRKTLFEHINTTSDTSTNPLDFDKLEEEVDPNDPNVKLNALQTFITYHITNMDHILATGKTPEEVVNMLKYDLIMGKKELAKLGINLQQTQQQAPVQPSINPQQPHQA